MGTLENTFSWSNSRAGTFGRCLRAYWWQYYGSWGGWERSAPPATRDAYMLKNLSNRWAWAGTAVHEWIERLLKRIQDESGEAQFRFAEHLDVEAEVEALTELMRRQYRLSLQGHYRESPKRNFGLLEHEYRDAVSKEEWVATSERARSALRGFLEGDVFETIRKSDPSTWFAIEQLDQFHLGDVGVWAAPDFARRLEDGEAEVCDWKTGAVTPEKSQLQMACYALYMEEKHGYDATRIRTSLVYLGPEVQVHSRTFSRADLDTARDEMRQSMDAMRARLTDAEKNTAEMDSFPMTEHRSRCATCAFRRLCHR